MGEGGLKDDGMVKNAGLGIVMTTIFIAGQMAGGGVLMLPGAMVSTGRGSGILWWLMIIIIM